MTLHLLENVVQPYPWGTRAALTEFLGVPCTGDPQAELWMGAHPRGSSRLVDAGQSLLDWIAADPERSLGRDVVGRFGPRLPYLFKVLSADEPLSLQAHPSKEQAERGFARENDLGLAADAPERNYRDDNHKPELLCALSSFWALCGFRAPEEILALAEAFEVRRSLTPFVELARDNGAQGLARAFRSIFELPVEERRAAIGELAAGARHVLATTPIEAATELTSVARWTLRISELYPEDPGVIATLFLNLVQLEPGQAIYLPAGELHAYLSGVGLEIMAASDNVLRGGLTSKRVDLTELMNVLRFEPRKPSLVEGQRVAVPGGGEVIYPTEAREFLLSLVELDDGAPWQGGRGPEILLCLEGSLELERGARRMELLRGDSAFCEAAEEPFTARGKARFARARTA